MSATEYRQAINRASRILAYVQIAEGKRAGVKLSKRAARAMVIGYSGEVDSIWIDEDETILLVG